ncbi:MAG: Acetyl-CoA:oxalate CoA-transferase [Bryobacteraceae bacterium]|nr:Acetyl-CoA:oxalate CoA-transferase [Bryobacteraceae bacterium]
MISGSAPLAGLLVLDFSQFLSGPCCALRLGDLGARVIKIERPESGDLCRSLYISSVDVDGDSTLFHSINRNKQSFAADLKNEEDLARVRALVSRADVLIQNFRPGVMERLGLGFEAARALNPRLIYAAVTGYGDTGPWRDKPGQDLLAQALSGIMWLNGDENGAPVPLGLSVADLIAGAHLAQGILACLVRRGITGEGGLVEVSLIESILDLQFELLTTHLNDGGKQPLRSEANNANAYLGAPYGVYRTADGFLAIAMAPVPRLGALTGCAELADYPDPSTWFTQRDAIKRILAAHFLTAPTRHWLDRLEPAGIWCAPVLTWSELLRHPGFQCLDMLQEIQRPSDGALTTTRCPIRIDGSIAKSPAGAPRVGEHTEAICREFGL